MKSRFDVTQNVNQTAISSVPGSDPPNLVLLLITSVIMIGAMFVSVWSYIKPNASEEQRIKRLSKSKEKNLNKFVFRSSAAMNLACSFAILGVTVSGTSPNIILMIAALNFIAAGALGVSCASLSAPFKSGYAANSRSQERTVNSLEEGSKQGNYSFLRQFNLIGKFRGRKNTEEHCLLTEFNANEEEDSLFIRELRNRRSNSSGVSYGAAGKTTSVL